MRAAAWAVSAKTRWILAACWTVVVLAQIPGVRLLRQEGLTGAEILRASSGQLGVLVLLTLFFALLAWLQPYFAARRVVLRTVEWDLQDEGVTIQHDVGSSSLKWGIFLRFRETKTVLLLYVQKGMANFIPKRVLDEAQLSDLRALIQRHVKSS
ncbi:MAG TPA: YcxB family protein [Acidobacteriaceae bacterium]